MVWIVWGAFVGLFFVLEVMFTNWIFANGFNFIFAIVWIVASAMLLGACLIPAGLVMEAYKEHKMTPAQRNKYRAKKARESEARMEEYAAKAIVDKFGGINSALLCPHCQNRGSVRMIQAVRVTKNRVNSVAGKAIGLGTNSESQVTQLHCDNCGMTWDA